jgi:hypothetical protein
MTNLPLAGRSLALTGSFETVQTDLAAKTYQSAIRLCNQFGLTSERGVALMFDIVTQNGSISAPVKAQILADYPPNEVPQNGQHRQSRGRTSP